MEQFFDVLVPLGKFALLRDCIVHEIADEAPDRILHEEETIAEMADLGFYPVQVRGRLAIGALLEAYKPGEGRGEG
jgi:hypothetical protein